MSIDLTSGGVAQRTLAAPAPGFATARRALIRLEAKRTSNAIIRELLAIHREQVPGRPPLFARLDLLCRRYEALGGDPSDLRR
jgi:hypothetical protein